MNNENNSSQKIRIATFEEFLGAPPIDSTSAEEIDVVKLFTFNNHPFKVVNDDAMKELIDSIQCNGIINPLIVRSNNGVTYEIISGHRRLYAAKQLGLSTVPAIVRDLSDDEATILMVDSNIQRMGLLPSEKAWALKMKHDAMLHQGATFGHNVQKWTHEEIGEDMGISGRQAQRYIRLTELHPDFLEMVDKKKINMVNGVALSFLSLDNQKVLLELFNKYGPLKPKSYAKLKCLFENKEATAEEIEEFYDNEKKEEHFQKVDSITFSGDRLKKLFPADVPESEWESIIIALISNWVSDNQN